VRLNRRRFWAGEMDADKLSAYQTLYTTLRTVAQLMAPFAPFYADKLYSDLVAPVEGADYVTVHLSAFPTPQQTFISKELEEQMSLAQEITSSVLALRRKVNIKVRQPLQTLLVPVTGSNQRTMLEAVSRLIVGEVNVKELKIVDNEESGLVKRVKADFKKLGPRYGKIMKQLGAAIKEMPQSAIATLERDGQYCFAELEGAPVVTTSDVEIIPEDIPGWLVANDGDITVALDVTLTESLKAEGLARELVNRIQNIRKSSGFDITDKVDVKISSLPQTEQALKAFGNYISSQVLAETLEVTASMPADEAVQQLDIDDLKVSVLVKKIAK
jgi:isoleucyl-tRNA synthetase